MSPDEQSLVCPETTTPPLKFHSTIELHCVIILIPVVDGEWTVCCRMSRLDRVVKNLDCPISIDAIVWSTAKLHYTIGTALSATRVASCGVEPGSHDVESTVLTV